MSVPALESAFSVKGSRYNYRHQLGEFESLFDDLRRMLIEGRYILTDEVQDFERDFAQYCGCSYARGVNTGTDALIIALRALEIGPGERVLTQANTFHATVAAIELAGATPVLVDADNDTFLINVDELEAKAGEQISAIIPVHLFGKPTPMEPVLKIARKHGLTVIEDAAQAHGAVTEGRRTGSFGAAGCFSFHPSKNLAAAGDAGAIVTDSQSLATRVDECRSLGQRKQNEHLIVGLNSRLDALQARILSWKLQRLDGWNRARRRVAHWYRSALAGLPLSFQTETDGEVHVYHLLQIRTAHRDSLLQFLRAAGVDAVIRYPTPIHLQPAFKKWGWRSGQFPVAESLARELLCLPIRPDMDESEVGFIASKVHAIFAQRSEKQKRG